MKATIAPRAAAAPRLRAGPGPGVGSDRSRTPGKPAQTATGGAAEPLSTTMTSKAGAVAALRRERGEAAGQQRRARSGAG